MADTVTRCSGLKMILESWRPSVPSESHALFRLNFLTFKMWSTLFMTRTFRNESCRLILRNSVKLSAFVSKWLTFRRLKLCETVPSDVWWILMWREVNLCPWELLSCCYAGVNISQRSEICRLVNFLTRSSSRNSENRIWLENLDLRLE
jgi:hypothetical protein